MEDLNQEIPITDVYEWCRSSMKKALEIEEESLRKILDGPENEKNKYIDSSRPNMHSQNDTDIISQPIIVSDEDKSLDSKQLDLFTFLGSELLPPIYDRIKQNPHKVREMCTSSNNSRPIADFMEQLTAQWLTRITDKSDNYDGEVYMSGNEGRTDHDRMIFKDKNEYCCLHLDNKGVRVKFVWKEYKITELMNRLKELGHNPTLGKKKWEPLIQYIKEHNLLNNGIDGRIKEIKNKKKETVCERIEYNTLLYGECNKDDDHPDQNLHMKCSQSNLSGFSSTIEGGAVTYNGLIPKDLNIPHFTFIMKHIYSEDCGIHKLVLIAVPHCSIQTKYFPDIQKDGERVRMAKAKDEFRFNMNYSKGNPYTFLGTDIHRYKVFDIRPDIKYV